jgi:hypothetical protein
VIVWQVGLWTGAPDDTKKRPPPPAAPSESVKRIDGATSRPGDE